MTKKLNTLLAIAAVTIAGLGFMNLDTNQTNAPATTEVAMDGLFNNENNACLDRSTGRLYKCASGETIVIQLAMDAWFNKDDDVCRDRNTGRLHNCLTGATVWSANDADTPADMQLAMEYCQHPLGYSAPCWEVRVYKWDIRQKRNAGQLASANPYTQDAVASDVKDATSGYLQTARSGNGGQYECHTQCR